MLKSLSKETKEIWVGIITLFLGLILVLFFSNRDHKLETVNSEKYFVMAHFNKADGIISGDIVRLAGLPVGTIEDINLNESFGVDVKIVLPKDVLLPEDSSASIHTSGLFGRKYIEIEPGGMYETIANGGSILYTQDSMLIEDLLNKIISIGRSIRGIPEENEDGE